ncbi:MAG TPA: hypothetical protein VGG39_12970 [Polyangiaceae bacterium]|jgi:hypothetical protein
MRRRIASLFAATALASVLAACVGGSGPLPGTKSAGDVQTAGLAQTAVGKNKCDPKSSSRPFVIEWDATDMSSFEARAANDVVFVKYVGCDLQIVEGCSQDSLRGSFGSYKPVEWTSGSVESLDINNDGDLYAKLPLGAASLEGRVEGGEKFHMEYFVSGTRSATRESVARNDLAKVPACKDATHFVYAYNLGAFALGSQSSIKGSVGATVWGFGGGADRSSSSKAEKAGGLLSSCRGESAKDVATCRVPIRLTLREITEGDSQETAEAQAVETPEAKNLAGKLMARTDREHKASEHADAARQKANSKDGPGCMAELDQHDKLDPRPEGLSTNFASAYAMTRAQCIMLSGNCAAGKVAYRKALEKSAGAQLGPEQLDKSADAVATMWCQGSSMAPRDQLLKALFELQQGAYMSKKTVAACDAAYQTAKRLVPTVKPNDDDDNQVKQAGASLRTTAPTCFAKAGDCATAWTTWKEAWKLDPNLSPQSRNLNDDALRHGFDAVVRQCKDK